MTNYQGIPDMHQTEVDFFTSRGYQLQTIKDFNDLAFSDTEEALQEAKNGIIEANEHLNQIDHISVEKEDDINNAKRLYKEAARLNEQYAINPRAVMPVSIYTKAKMAKILSEEIIKKLIEEKQPTTA